MIRKKMKYAVIVFISILLGWLSNSHFSVPPAVQTIRDTVTIQPPPVIVEKIKPQLIYLRDTVIKTKPS